MACPAYEQSCYPSWRTGADGMVVLMLAEALARAVAEDSDCSFAGRIGEGVTLNRQGRLCLTLQVPLTDEQIARLRRRMPEVDLLQDTGRLS